MARRKKAATQSTAEKPRHRVKWPAKQWGAGIEIDVFVRQAGERDKVASNRTGSNSASPPKAEEPQKLALTPEQLAASNANLAAIRDGVKKAAAGEKLEVTPEPEPETPENLGVKQPPEELPIADARPHLTQAEIRALTQPETDDTWSEAVKGMLLALGAVVAFIWLAAVGIGGCAAFIVGTVVLQKALQW